MDEIIKHFNNYPNTVKFLTELNRKFYRSLNDYPEIINSDWDKDLILEDCYELMDIIPFACLVMDPTVQEKIAQSELFKEYTKKWFVTLKDIESSLDLLVAKYPELDKDMVLLCTIDYKFSIIAYDILGFKLDSIYNEQPGDNDKVIKILNQKRKVRFKKILENYKKRMRETPKNKKRAIATFSRLSISIFKQLEFNKLNPHNDNRVNKFKEFLTDGDLNPGKLIDSFFYMNELLDIEIYGKVKAKKLLRSNSPNGNQLERLRFIPFEDLKHYKQRELYRDLFDYLYSFMKVEQNLLSFEEYDVVYYSNDSRYDGYNEYKENKAKIVFGLT